MLDHVPQDWTRFKNLEVGGTSMHVLIAEDDQATRDLAARALEAAGHTVLACDDGPSAASALTADGNAVDLVITDVEMPGMGGAELAARARSSNPTVKILLISGFEAELDKAHTSLGSTAGKLLKPFTLAELRKAVDDVTS